MVQTKKKAPARAKATENYILTTKLFCGHCEAAMTGTSGTGRHGGIYHYYQCINARKKQCDKKTVKKQWIEDLVVNETMHILTDENIDLIARQVVELCEREENSEALKRLRKLQSDNEKAVANLMEALKLGKIADVLLDEIKKLKYEHSEIGKQIEYEQAQHPILTVPVIKMFMKKFKTGDIHSMAHRIALVDTFVSKVYLEDKKITILYNVQDGRSDISLDDVSSEEQMVELRTSELHT